MPLKWPLKFRHHQKYTVASKDVTSEQHNKNGPINSELRRQSLPQDYHECDFVSQNLNDCYGNGLISQNLPDDTRPLEQNPVAVSEPLEGHQIHFTLSSSYSVNNAINAIPESNCDQSNNNVTRVQVHHEPSWISIEQQTTENEKRKLLLPSYKSPPEYETFIRHLQDSGIPVSHEQQTNEDENLNLNLTYEERKLLLPSYRPPPEYETFMRHLKIRRKPV